jgi:hypothetical protein
MGQALPQALPAGFLILSLSLVPYAMLDYVKTILLKVSFNKALFEKELRKALKVLTPTEVPDFRSWCYQQFARIYRKVLKRVFGSLELATS